MSSCFCCCGPEERIQSDGRSRGFTDCTCFLLFAVCLGLQGALIAYGFQNGDLSLLAGLPSSRGDFCGAGAAAETPFLYFCKGSEGHYDPTDSHCVADCSHGHELCEAHLQYDTEPLFGQLCLPADHRHLHDMAMQLWDSPAVEMLMEGGELRRAWQPVVISAIAAIIAAFCYLFFLEWATGIVLWGSILLSVLIPAALGSFLILASQTGGIDGLSGTGDSTLDVVLGAVLTVVSLSFACIACWKVNSVNEAIECIKATCECIREMPTLLFEPIVMLLIKVPLIVALVVGGLALSTCVAEVHHAARSLAHPYVSIEYSPDERVYLAFYVVVSLWIMEFVSALSQFAVSYATQLWWFAHHRNPTLEPAHSPSFAACGGVRIGLCYHTGTLAFGAFVVPLARLPRLLLRPFAAMGSSRDNAVGRVCAACCCCCTSCYDRFLRFLTKNAYMDVAVNGSDFCQAAHHSSLALEHEATAAAVLNGATWLFQVTGLAAISFGGAFLTYFQLSGIVAFSDSMSPEYVEDPIFLVGFSFVVCFLVTLPFMLVLDHVSDSILYCFAVENEKGCAAGAVGGFTPMPAAGLGGKVDRYGPETQALLQRARSRQ